MDLGLTLPLASWPSLFPLLSLFAAHLLAVRSGITHTTWPEEAEMRRRAESWHLPLTAWPPCSAFTLVVLLPTCASSCRPKVTSKGSKDRVAATADHVAASGLFLRWPAPPTRWQPLLREAVVERGAQQVVQQQDGPAAQFQPLPPGQALPVAQEAQAGGRSTIRGRHDLCP